VGDQCVAFGAACPGLAATCGWDLPNACGTCGREGQNCCGLSLGGGNGSCTGPGVVCAQTSSFGSQGCQVCGAPGEPCCAFNDCQGGACCVEGTCVAQGQVCFNSVTYGVCNSGICSPYCGALEQYSCNGTGANNDCTMPYSLQGGGTCSACGAFGEPCCFERYPGNDLYSCGGGLTCSSTSLGRCQ
jgi:hypothetical protein